VKLKAGGYLVKILITAGLFWLIARKLEWAEVGTRLAEVSWWNLIFVLALIAVQNVVLTERWCLITRSLGSFLPRRDGLVMMLASQFFNQGLPSSLGGDAVRIWCLQRAGMRFSQAAIAVTLDRAIGFITLLVLTAFTLPVFVAIARNRGPIELVGLAVAAGLVLLAIGVSPLGRAIVRSLQRRLNLSGLGFVFDLLRGLRGLLKSRAIAVPVIGYGVLAHLLSVAVVYVLALGINASVTPGMLFVVMPTVMLVSFLPISLAGWGVREAALVSAFSLVGASTVEAVLISVAMGLCYLAFGLLGGIIWLFSSPAAGIRVAQPAPPEALSNKRNVQDGQSDAVSALREHDGTRGGFRPHAGRASPVDEAR
jgi:uncharacterized protein (TIRG00374 family)